MVSIDLPDADVGGEGVRTSVSLRAVLGGLVALLAGVLVGKLRLERSRARLVEELLGAADARSERAFTRDDVEGLPPPVRRYFDTVLEEGQPYVRTVRLEQRGQFRLGDADAPWRTLEATQHYTVDPPGFVWDATVAMAPLVPVRVVDQYRDGEGSLRARLLSAVTVAEAEPSPETNAGELMRYLAESVWFPTALLPTEGVEWEPIDERSARATLDHDGTTVSLVFHFDDRNTVERVVAEDRYRRVDDGFEPTRWTGYFRNYRHRNGMFVPVDAEVEWNLPDGNLPYWRARITALDHRPVD
ncbi:DUF6920 family protein [Halomicrococcus sp. SG-WS-1]|uniref:DUF6920 family protein n=1 Tax=Halomicrococcus sp. SG-WS-1 TaxID=3439057 RepID=UPI003F78BCB2